MYKQLNVRIPLQEMHTSSPKDPIPKIWAVPRPKNSKVPVLLSVEINAQILRVLKDFLRKAGVELK